MGMPESACKQTGPWLQLPSHKLPEQGETQKSSACEISMLDKKRGGNRNFSMEWIFNPGYSWDSGHTMD